jgi:hypothetical protein
MLRSIRRTLLAVFTTNSRRKARCRPRRRLNFENLERRELLSATPINDGNFEVPVLAAQTYQYAPGGSPWQFVGGAGVCANGSAFNNRGAPVGTQAAFLQSTCKMSESVYLDAGTYNLSFMAAQRRGQKHYQEFTVLVDGALVATVTPADTIYRSYETANFTVATGAHTIQFIGFNPLGGDNTAFVDEVGISPVVDSLSDGSFEVPGLAANALQYAPGGSPWQFAGSAGVCSNNSAFTDSSNYARLPIAGNPPAPDGVQVAFVQGTGTVSQSLYLDAGTYTLSFLAAQRAGRFQAHYQELQVLVDQQQVGMITPTDTTYELYQTANFTVTAGPHTVEFIGVNPAGGDNTAFVDEVAISQANPIGDNNFAAPALAANTYKYGPSGSPWQFTGGAGVCGNGSALGNPAAPLANPDAPNVGQAGFFHGYGSMSQTVDMAAGTYSLSCLAAQQAGQRYSQEFEVLIDGAQVGVITPIGAAYQSYQTPTFTVTAGTHTVELASFNPQGGDGTAFVDEVAISSTTDSINDGSFAVPGLTANTFQYSPDGSPWQFVGGAGVCRNGSAFGNRAAPDGDQVAFLQSTGSISESVYLDAGTYSLSFMAAQRGGQKHPQEFEVLVGSTQVDLVTPAYTVYGSYQTANFTVVAGTYTIRFTGLDPSGGDSTAFVGEVAIASTADSLTDGSFEVPALTANTYQVAPSGSPWQFTGGAGVCTNSSALGNPNAPDGTQAAFVVANGGMSQSVYMDAGTYSVSFMAAQLAGQKQYEEFGVLLDGTQVGTITLTSTSYTWYQSPNFTVSAGPHTIGLLGLNTAGADSTAFIDEAQLS